MVQSSAGCPGLSEVSFRLSRCGNQHGLHRTGQRRDDSPGKRVERRLNRTLGAVDAITPQFLGFLRGFFCRELREWAAQNCHIAVIAGGPIRVIRAIRGSDFGCGLPRCESVNKLPVMRQAAVGAVIDRAYSSLSLNSFASFQPPRSIRFPIYSV